MPPRRPSSAPTVVLVGRPNVGKSTLFNRITDSRRAIVTAIAGTTRDVNSLPAEWQGTTFRLVDTGGMFGASEDPLHELVVIQGRKALQEADVLVFVVDGREGLVSGDEEIAGFLRSVSAPVVVAVNKTDDKRARGRAVEFYQMGFDTIVELAAEHGDGVGDLLDEITALMPSRRESATAEAPEETAVAIVGRPNVGKSSLLNKLLHEERSIVSEMPGTTRDTVDAVLKWRKRIFRIVDTAGIRRPGRVARSGQLEAVSVIVAKRAIEKADVAVLVIDAVEGATDQDATIAGEADKAGAGIIIVANKWDLMKGRGTNFSKEFDDKLRQQLKFLDYAQVLHISAAHRRAHGQGARDGRQGCRRAQAPHPDVRAESVRRRRDGRSSTGEPGPAGSAHSLRGADRGRAADVRLLHERRHGVSLLLRTIPGEPAEGVVRPDRDADPHPRAAPGKEGTVTRSWEQTR